MIGRSILCLHFIKKLRWDRNLFKLVSMVLYKRMLIDLEIVRIKVRRLRMYYGGNTMRQ